MQRKTKSSTTDPKGTVDGIRTLTHGPEGTVATLYTSSDSSPDSIAMTFAIQAQARKDDDNTGTKAYNEGKNFTREAGAEFKGMSLDLRGAPPDAQEVMADDFIAQQPSKNKSSTTATPALAVSASSSSNRPSGVAPAKMHIPQADSILKLRYVTLYTDNVQLMEGRLSIKQGVAAVSNDGLITITSTEQNPRNEGCVSYLLRKFGISKPSNTVTALIDGKPYQGKIIEIDGDTVSVDGKAQFHKVRKIY